MHLSNTDYSPQARQFVSGNMIASRLRNETSNLSSAACQELGFPVAFVEDQINYAAQCLDNMPTWTRRDQEAPEAAFLFPSNTEGAMPVYILALASSMGLLVHAKLSRRSPKIQACLERIFAPTGQITFHSGSGRTFLQNALEDPHVRFIQVFGDDAWIHQYEEQVRIYGKTLAFDGPGKDPVIILKGADLDEAVQATVASGLFAGGAACMSPERFLVHETLLDAFLDGLAKHLSCIQPMPPDEPAAVLGYLYSQRAVMRMQEQVAEAIQNNATIILNGQVEPVQFKGHKFYACSPMILNNVPLDSRILNEETFGPIFPILSFKTTGEAVALAENSQYGLTATVFGSEETAGLVAQQLRASHAIVYVNETMLDAFRPEYWGSGGYKRSGWIWETQEDGAFQTRTGYRPLQKELAKIIAQYTKEAQT